MQGRDEAMKEIIRGTIQEMFMSTDPKIVELRMQMFHEAGALTQQGQAQMPPGTSQPPRYPVDEIMKPMVASLHVPWGRTGKEKTVA